VGVLSLPANVRGGSRRFKYILGPYRRFMDDWLIFADSRKSLRLIRLTAQRVLRKLELVEHPDKTFLGAVRTRFHFLGVEFGAILQLPVERLLKIKTKIAACRQRNDGSELSYCEHLTRYLTHLQRQLAPHAMVLPIGLLQLCPPR
jgi:hypothetical protein